jgi:phosphopantothenate-cysteine ligase
LNILVTAGGTTEKIDDVRAISNNSTGRLGAAIADAFLNSDKYSVDKLFYVCGLSAAAPVSNRAEIIRIGSVSHLASVLEELLSNRQIDAVILSMAVSDYGVETVTTKGRISEAVAGYLKEEPNYRGYSPENLAARITDYIFQSSKKISTENKLSSDIDDLIITMKKTPKIISMIKKLQPQTILVGFKLLSNTEHDVLIDTAYRLLQRNACDMVLANDLSEITQDRHTGYLIMKDKSYLKLETKAQIAAAIAGKVYDILMSKGSVQQ